MLHASPTRTLLHAEASAKSKSSVYTLATLTDEAGEVLVDQTGEPLGAWGKTPVIIFHADPTSTLVHAEDSK